MNPRKLGNNRRRRGTMLCMYVFLIPIVTSLFLCNLTRIDVDRLEIRRTEWRAQARLLAESALMRVAQGEHPPIMGEIEGAGSYRIEKVAGMEDHLLATGSVEDLNGRYLCRIELRTGKGHWDGWYPAGDNYHVDPLPAANP